jgi:hypothetical protein
VPVGELAAALELHLRGSMPLDLLEERIDAWIAAEQKWSE